MPHLVQKLVILLRGCISWGTILFTFIYLFIYLFIYIFICLFVCLLVYLFTCFPAEERHEIDVEPALLPGADDGHCSSGVLWCLWDELFNRKVSGSVISAKTNVRFDLVVVFLIIPPRRCIRVPRRVAERMPVSAPSPANGQPGASANVALSLLGAGYEDETRLLTMQERILLKALWAGQPERRKWSSADVTGRAYRTTETWSLQ